MIFTITGIHTLDKSWDSRCFGFYYTFHYAELSVINNNEQNIFERIDWPKELIHFTNFGID